MEKEFIPYEQALELKELGFDEPCFGYYVDGEIRGVNLGIEELGGVSPYYQRFGFHTLSNHDINNPNKIITTSPTFSQAFRWFRDKKLTDGSICRHGGADGGSSYRWDILYEYGVYEERHFKLGYKTHEEAELACLIKLIEVVKKK